MKKHTKGPWTILDSKLVHSNGYRIAELLSERDHGKANAALIAAAPEMLEALERLCDEPECPDHISAYLIPILKKAKGES